MSVVINPMRKTIISLLTISLLLITSIASVNALELYKQSKPSFEVDTTFANIYVDDDAAPGGDGAYGRPFQNIQDGIDAASAGDIVFVLEGLYYENVEVYKPLTLIGQDQTTTIINGGGNGNVLNISSSYVTFKKFSIENSGSSGWPPGIAVWSNNGGTYIRNIYITDCTIRYNYGGISFNCVAECAVTNCHIHNCDGASIFFKDDFSENILIDNCIINDNGEIAYPWFNSGGVTLSLDKLPLTNNLVNIRISNCNIFDNEGAGISISNNHIDRIFDNIEISYNNIYRNSIAGISILNARDLQIHHNTIDKNGKYGILLSGNQKSGCCYSILQNIISKNGGYQTSDLINAGLFTSECINCVTIKHNTFTSNEKFGVLLTNSLGNKIIENNFIDNKNSSFFIYDTKDYSNTWDKNYWNRPRYLPKPIFGLISGRLSVEFDLHPAKTPYDILI